MAKIYLISPTHYTPDGNLVKSVHYWTSAITLPYLAALTPPEHAVSHTDEIVEALRFDVPADLVAITTPTPSALHAYRIAREFRSRGVPVVIG